MGWPDVRPLIGATAPVVAASPKAFWRFQDDLTDDASVGPYDLALTAGTETYIDVGNGRTAAVLDNSTYFTATGFKGITGSNPRAISMWIKTSLTGRNQQLIGWGSNTAGARWSMGIGPTGLLVVFAVGGNVIGSVNVADGQWHHIVSMLESGDTDVNLTKLYVDAVQDTDGTSVSEPVDTASDADVSVAIYTVDGTGTLFVGQMDEVAIFDTLTEADITAIYQGNRTPSENGFNYKESTEAWVTNDLPRSGGRYKHQLIAVSDQGNVYFGSA